MRGWFHGLLAFAALAATLAGAGLARASIAIPQDNDDYSRLVARAEADDPGVDFHALRFAWLDSAARKRAPLSTALNQQLKQAVAANNPGGVRATAEQLISVDYTDISAHKYRRQSCHILADAACEQHEHFVEFGLLNSIIEGRNGKTVASAWEVASIKEEYFIIAMIGLKPGRQSLMNIDRRAYDHFDATDEAGAAHELFFDTTVMLPKEL